MRRKISEKINQEEVLHDEDSEDDESEAWTASLSDIKDPPNFEMVRRA